MNYRVVWVFGSAVETLIYLLPGGSAAGNAVCAALAVFFALLVVMPSDTP